MQRILNFLDSLDFSLLGMAAIIAILTIVRLFFESFSSPESTRLFAVPTVVISYTTLYIMLITMFTIRLAFLARKPMMWALRVMIFIFPVVMITPLIDLAFSRGQGFCIGYIQTGGKTLAGLFLNFLGPHAQMCGMTPGLRIQVIGGMVIVSVIIFLITKSWWRSIAGAFISYTISFIGGALPVIVNIITRSVANPTFESSTVNSLINTIHYPTSSLPFVANLPTMTGFLLARVQFLGMIIGLAIIWFYASRDTWRAWWFGSLKKIPVALVPMVMTAFGLIVGFGGFEGGYHLLWPDWLGIILLFLALFFSCWSVGAVNDMADVSIDRVANPDYPMIKYKMSVEHMKTIQYVSLALALVAALLVNYNAFFCIIVFIGAYTFHSSHLLRMKRFWLTSSFCIVLAGCAAFFAGFFTLSPDQTVGHFPLVILGMIAMILFPYSIIKDVPDIAGDKVQNLHTFPILYGIRAAIVVVIGLVILWFVLFSSIIPWFFALGLVVPVIVIAFKRQLIHKKVWLLGIPAGIWAAGIIIQALFFL